jgi:putative endonuclease
MTEKRYVYILASGRNGTLYIGSTTDLENRVRAHKAGLFSGFTFKYNVKQLVYFEEHESAESALKRERNMKEWKRQWKINLIEKNNPEWVDLSRGWIPAFAGTKI